MKTLVLIGSLFASTFAHAAPSFVLAQVLTSPQVAKLTEGASVTKIEETGVARCLGCYEFRITQQTPVGGQAILVKTRANGPGSVLVEVVSVSK